MPTSRDERRKEIRRPAAGAVLLRPVEAYSEVAVIHAELCDISERGFRASHSCMTVCTGDSFFFEHQLQRGRAQVVWTFIQGERVESGFRILPSS